MIVPDGDVIGASHNEVGLQHDPTAHAEIVAIRRACAARASEDIRGAILYSHRLREIVEANCLRYDDKSGTVSNLTNALNTKCKPS